MKSGSGSSCSSRQMPTPSDEAGDSADDGDDGGLDEELAADVDGCCSESFADADLAGALGDGDEHDVHYADAAQREGQECDGSEEEGHGAEDSFGELRALQRVPHPERFLVVGVEVVAFGEDLLTCRTAFSCRSGETGSMTMLLTIALDDAGLLRQEGKSRAIAE